MGAILTNCEVDVCLVHSLNAKPVGRVGLPLKFLESGEQKKTPSSMVIVADKYVELKAESKVTGLVRIVLYLEDLGVVKRSAAASVMQMP